MAFSHLQIRKLRLRVVMEATNQQCKMLCEFGSGLENCTRVTACGVCRGPLLRLHRTFPSASGGASGALGNTVLERVCLVCHLWLYEILKTHDLGYHILGFHILKSCGLESLAQRVEQNYQGSGWPWHTCPCALGQLPRVSAGVLHAFCAVTQ